MCCMLRPRLLQKYLKCLPLRVLDSSARQEVSSYEIPLPGVSIGLHVLLGLLILLGFFERNL